MRRKTPLRSRVGSLPRKLAQELKTLLGLRRAIETGTYMGGGARALSEIFDAVVTVELSHDLHRRAAQMLAEVSNVRLVHGDSRVELRSLAAERIATFYWLDGHWSGGETAGAGHECPVLDELAAIGSGHPDDCVLIDDARLFAAAPPPPHDPTQWPTLLELLDAIRANRSGHHITLVHDLVVAVPKVAEPAIARFGREPLPQQKRRRLPTSLSFRRRRASAS